MPHCHSPVAFASRLGQETLVNRFKSLLDGRDRIVRKGGIADLTPIPTRLNQNGENESWRHNNISTPLRSLGATGLCSSGCTQDVGS
jgi:hypothetical protein